MRQIVFDIETTGFRFDEGHRIVEIGALEMAGGAVTVKAFHTYVNPQRDMPEGAFKVHGLSARFLADKPVFADPIVGPAFLDFVGDAQLIAHNGDAFDVPFINAELEAAGLSRLVNKTFDTLIFARRKYPGAPASLDALCARFGIDTSTRERDGHGALLDSRLLAAVYIELTGGAQAGLDFGAAAASVTGDGPPRARRRPGPPPSLLTEEEKAAHATLVDELGPNSLWPKLSGAAPV
jgi:DNA polymerase-3 subunit epsilon